MKYDGEDKFIDLLYNIPNVAIQGYNKERNVIYWNKASEEIYGYSKDEVVGRKLEELIIPEDMKKTVIDNVNNWFQNGVEIPCEELVLKHKDGSDVFVYSSHVLLKQDQGDPEMFCIDVDLSQRVKKDLELKKKEQLLYQQSKMATMGDMLGNIAHQWRQPLSTITTAATGIKLQKEMDVLNEENLFEALDAINNSAQYLSSTIDDFRGFFNPNKNEESQINILDIFDKTLKLVKAQFVAKEVEIIQNIENNTLISIENQLVQVLINILNNAKDALLNTKDQRRIIFINSYKKDSKLFIEVLDNAGGVSKDIINKIFDAYFTTKNESVGTGIGLYISQDIIKNHLNGVIDVSNENYLHENISYKGAKFTIILPII